MYSSHAVTTVGIFTAALAAAARDALFFFFDMATVEWVENEDRKWGKLSDGWTIWLGKDQVRLQRLGLMLLLYVSGR